MELHVFVQLWNRVSAPKLNEANTIPAIENGECCVREHTLLIRCRCSVCYCHRKLLPFDSSTYISEGKTSKRQRRKYMIPNRRPSFTSNVSIGYSMWPFCFLRIACSMFESVAYTTWLARLATKKIQSDLPLERYINRPNGTITNRIYFVFMREFSEDFV